MLLERFVQMLIGKVVLQIGIHQRKNVNNLAVGFENAVNKLKQTKMKISTNDILNHTPRKVGRPVPPFQS